MEKKSDYILYIELVTKCWDDDALYERFLTEPKQVMQEAGINVEEDVEYRVVEEQRGVKYVVLPFDTEGVEEALDIVDTFLSTIQKQRGMIIPIGKELRIIQETEKIRFVSLPVSPKRMSVEEVKMTIGDLGVRE